MDSTLSVSAEQLAPPKRPLAIANWLLAVAGLVFLMVVVGGITRLTESGLSITEWKPVTGAIPPLTQADWNHAFDLYKKTPEYLQVNGPAGMTLEQFKFIFFWEWFHRLLGRLIGLAFALPLLWFAARRAIPEGYGWKLVGLLILGGLQGALGWYMVMSGLVDRTDVSHFRLSAHLLLAFAIIVVWEKFDSAENIVAREAGAATNVYRLSYGMAAAPATSLRARLSAYLAATISDDWPAMEHANESSAARLALDAVYGSVLVTPEGRDSALVAEILHQLDVITQERRARIVAADGTVPKVIWPVLFGGAAITVGFTFFFGTQNLSAQAFMTGLLTSLIFSGLLIVVLVDRPFSGTVMVKPDALAKVLAEFGTTPATQ